MAKNIGITLLLLIIVSTGIGYAIFSAPELPEHKLFKLAIKQFASNAAELEKQFQEQSWMSSEQKPLSLDYSDLDGLETSITVSMQINKHTVTLVFGEGNTEFSNQSIIFEPYFPKQSPESKQIRWKCIGGSVLIRFRTKACRLGPGIDIADFNSF